MRIARTLLVLVALVGAAVPARAALVVTIPGNEFYEYFATPQAVTIKGGPLYLANADNVDHSIQSYAVRPAGNARWCGLFEQGLCPLFWSPLVARGAVAVEGLQDVQSGTEYEFYCGVHLWMHGTLRVL